MQPGHRDYQENLQPQPQPRGGSVLNELGEGHRARESVQGGNGLEEAGSQAQAGGRSHTRRPSLLEKIPFGIGQRLQENAKRDESQNQNQGGAVTDSAKTTTRKEVGSGAREHHRDSAHMRAADENRFPGSMYRTLRDEFTK